MLVVLLISIGDSWDGERVMSKFTSTARDQNISFKEDRGDFRRALIVTVNAAGEIVTCDVAHEAHTKKPFTSSGTLKLTDFKNEGGNVQGKLSTGGKAGFMGQSWEVNLTFETEAP